MHTFCLQEDFEFDEQAQFQEARSPSESTTPMEGENMGGWWPEQSAPDTGVRARTVSISMQLPSHRGPTWLLGCGVFVTCWTSGDPSHSHTFSYWFIISHQFLVWVGVFFGLWTCMLMELLPVCCDVTI